MYIIVGLGNPGTEYENTRHNVGFKVIDTLGDKYNIDVKERKSRAFVGSGFIEGKKVLLVKPQTFMNLSGEAVGALCNFYKIDVENELIVVYDDISLAPGGLRVRKKGSAGGHNGMKNIIAHTGTENFTRVRVGIGEKPKEMDLANYVLGKFSRSEINDIEDGIKSAADAVHIILTQSVENAMNEYNKKTSKDVI